MTDTTGTTGTTDRKDPTDTGTTGKPLTAIWPILRYRDSRAAMTFLADAFGFRTTTVHPEAGGPVVHAEMRWPLGGGVMLSDAETGDPVFAQGLGAAVVYVVTADAAATDALHERARAAGAEIVRAPRDEDYGSRDFAARDPEGNIWSFGTYAGE